MKANIDETTGDIFTEDGTYLCSLGEVLRNNTQDRGGVPDYDGDDEADEYEDENELFKPKAGISETLIKRQTTFKLPKNKKHIENALWLMFSGGIHQVMSNISNLKQYKETLNHYHASILSSMANEEVANEVDISDYIQLHIWGRNLISRASTFEGDGLRDATLMGRQLNPNAIDALRYTPEKEKSNGGGFFGFLKR